MEMTNNADVIASAALEEFAKLPKKRKPAVRDNGLHEWVPLSGIIAKGVMDLSGLLQCISSSV